jgi:hypothetical protein
MSRFITSALIAFGLTGSAATSAFADRIVVREPAVTVTHHRDYHHRPEVRYERHEYRRGYRWRNGDWRWERNEWAWHPGIYVRI